ncbi:universal stress protein [Desertihabitans brevis]|uniref:Universal stress protein n=1 Tax=Desertihabitans brevis TaxID=2268447 RepID=A0A367YZW5_9ACTN|nr:universal stress protein [Desertihabitans brevis]RCK71368.1 universal stress protein [Desertihabitans brevis]
MAIAVGFTSKPEGVAALETAIEEARLRDLGIIAVVPDEADLQVAQQRLAATGVAHEVRPCEELQPLADALLELAETSAVEFIVIGLRRRTPVGKLLLGSNAQRILLDAPCPVVAVKAAPHPPADGG